MKRHIALLVLALSACGLATGAVLAGVPARREDVVLSGSAIRFLQARRAALESGSGLAEETTTTAAPVVSSPVIKPGAYTMMDAALLSEEDISKSIVRMTQTLNTTRMELSHINRSLARWQAPLGVLKEAAVKDLALITRNKAAVAQLKANVSANVTDPEVDPLVARLQGFNMTVTAIGVRMGSGKKSENSTGGTLTERIDLLNRSILVNLTQLQSVPRDFGVLEDDLRDNITIFTDRVLREETNDVMKAIPESFSKQLVAASDGLG